MRRTLAFLSLFLPLTLLAPMAQAAEAPAASTAAAPSEAAPKEESAVTHHSLALDGETIKYTATAGTLLIKDDKDEPSASMFYVAYTKDGADLGHRPVTFLYNGGPGSASIWLHMGSVGPVRVETADAQATPNAPYSLVSNQYSLLDKTDLVFIDAIGTGYSHAVGKAKNKDFWGVDQDGKAFTQFIQRYLSKNGRWNSPKYLMGESYGTTRSALISNMLSNAGVALNGVILVSSILDFGTESFNVGNDLPFITNVPSYAAVAWYHNKLNPKPADLPAFLKEVRAFAAGEYADALMKGDKLDDATRADVLKKLSAYTGLSQTYLAETHLRIFPFRFMKELTRDEGVMVGRLDSRYTGIDHDNAGEDPEFDPADSYINGPFTAAFHDYMANTLDYTPDRDYLLSARTGRDWDWKHDNGFNPWWPGSLDVAEDLRQAMTHNPHMKVFVANGYFDLATPFFATEYTVDHMGLDPSLRGNVQFGYYDSGHMIYLHVAALKALKSDLAKFYDQTAAH
ncbi:MAG: S10 family peptidase [Gammaproteobacteria bacterium]|jgi:carboxypeptidase C (cathepsin A)|nr:peptidase S10 [Gammaproteobacteria bacterium]